MANNRINKYWYMLSSHLKQYYAVLVWMAIFCVIGIVIGIVLLYGEKSYLNLLTSKNQNMLGYISGSAKVFSIFWSRLFNGLFAALILFVFCLNYFTSFIGFIYIAYQSAVCTIMCGTLISYHGFSAILNVIFLMVPSNIILLAILAIMFSVFFARAYRQYKYKQLFANSFSHDYFWAKVLICVILMACLYVLVGLIIPIIFKGICLINY